MNAHRNSRSSLPPRRLRTARGSWISLFAMLMIFIGPLISQAMPMNQHASMPMDHSRVMGSAEHGCHDASDERGTSTQPAAQHHVLWEKCGYCNLLFSCPALPQTLTLGTLDGPRPSSLLTVAVRQGYARQTVFPGARSRAPPAFH